MRNWLLVVLVASLVGGCSKPAPKSKAKQRPAPKPAPVAGPPPSEKWQDAAAAYNGPTGSEMAKRVVTRPGRVAVDVSKAKFITDEELSERRSELVQRGLNLAREIQAHVATKQLAELAALAPDRASVNRVISMLPDELARAQAVAGDAQALAKEMQAWAALAAVPLPASGSMAKERSRDVEKLPPGLITAIQGLGPQVVTYQQEIATFAAFLDRNWGEFWTSEGQRMIRRAGFESEYAQAAKRLVEARRKYEKALQQVELQSRTKAVK